MEEAEGVFFVLSTLVVLSRCLLCNILKMNSPRSSRNKRRNDCKLVEKAHCLLSFVDLQDRPPVTRDDNPRWPEMEGKIKENAKCKCKIVQNLGVTAGLLLNTRPHDLDGEAVSPCLFQRPLFRLLFSHLYWHSIFLLLLLLPTGGETGLDFVDPSYRRSYRGRTRANKDEPERRRRGNRGDWR